MKTIPMLVNNYLFRNLSKQVCLFAILFFQIAVTNACLNANQFKMFPVGVSIDKIISIDFQIKRTSQVEGNRILNLKLDSIDKNGMMWILYSYMSVYDKGQNRISIIALDTNIVLGRNYTEDLSMAYQNGLKQVAKKYTDIEYFKPEYLSFCDYQKKCKAVEFGSDTTLKSNYLTYQGKKRDVKFDPDSFFTGLNEEVYQDIVLNDLSVNSVRIFKSSKFTVVMVHLATGDELSMNLITNDPMNVGNTEDGEIRLAKEYMPSFVFNDIKNSTYVEPLLHHGFGFDVFIVD